MSKPKSTTKYQLGPFQIEKKLGSGSFSNVYKAKLKNPTDNYNGVTGDKPVAIKYLFEAEGDKKQLIKRVEQAEELAHRWVPHTTGLLQTYGTFKQGNRLCVVLQYVKGKDMYDYMIEKPNNMIPESEIKQIIIEPAIGLYELHRHNILHRDIKIENILIDFDLGQGVLCDFGFIHYLGKMGDILPDEFFGTYLYYAPEQAVMKLLTDYGDKYRAKFSNSKASYGNKKSDIWSLGIVVLFGLLGDYPYERGGDETPAGEEKLLENIAEVKFKYDYHKFEGVSNSVKEWLDKTLETDPDIRYDMYQALTHPWMMEKYRHYISSINTPSHSASYEVQPAHGRQIAQRAAVQPTLQDINQKKNPRRLVGNSIPSSPVESTQAGKASRRQVVSPTPDQNVKAGGKITNLAVRSGRPAISPPDLSAHKSNTNVNVNKSIPKTSSTAQTGKSPGYSRRLLPVAEETQMLVSKLEPPRIANYSGHVTSNGDSARINALKATARTRSSMPRSSTVASSSAAPSPVVAKPAPPKVSKAGAKKDIKKPSKDKPGLSVGKRPDGQLLLVRRRS